MWHSVFSRTLRKMVHQRPSLFTLRISRRLESRYTVEIYRVFIRVNGIDSKVFRVAACKDAFSSHLSTLSSSSPDARSTRISFADPHGSAERPFSGWRNRFPFLRHWSPAWIIVTEICHESSITSPLTGLEITIARVSGSTVPYVHSCMIFGRICIGI